jgi:hypothetical protein
MTLKVTTVPKPFAAGSDAELRRNNRKYTRLGSYFEARYLDRVEYN